MDRLGTVAHLPYVDLEVALPMKRVVVVDDDKDICMLVHHRLTSMGITVDAYSDGKSGLEAIVAEPPDLAIVDVMMPGMDGLELTRALRASEVTKELPVVLFSALIRPQDREVGLAAGADHYVIKPFSVAELGAFVDKALGLHTCTVCGTPRGVDGVDLELEPSVGQSQWGWAATAYGDVCGECQAKAFKKLRW